MGTYTSTWGELLTTNVRRARRTMIWYSLYSCFEERTYVHFNLFVEFRSFQAERNGSRREEKL